MSSSSEYSEESSISEGELDKFEGTIFNNGNNKYLFIYKLGSGAFATVWLTYELRTKHYYAIKVQFPGDIEEGIDEIELLQEITKKKSPCLNTIIEHFVFNTDEGERLCMVFELMAGSLYDVMKTGTYSNGLPCDTVLAIARQVCIGLDALNKTHKMIHTDVKPENVLIVGRTKKIQHIIDELGKLNIDNVYKRHKSKKCSALEKLMTKELSNIDFDEIDYIYRDTDKNNNMEYIDPVYIDPHNIRVVLSDFGNAQRITEKHYKIQTRYYRAPEIILQYDVSERCDMWSVGCMMYELATGEILFDPHRQPGFSTDRHHLYDIIRFLGRVPPELLKKSKKYDVFFRKDGLIKGKHHIMYEPLAGFLDKQIPEQPSKEAVLHLMLQLLCYRPKQRPLPREVV